MFLGVASCFVIFGLIITSILIASGLFKAANSSYTRSEDTSVSSVEDDWFEQKKSESDDWFDREVERMKREQEQWKREHGFYDNNSTWNWNNSLGNVEVTNSISSGPISLTRSVSVVNSNLSGYYDFTQYSCVVRNDTNSDLTDLEFKLAYSGSNKGFSISPLDSLAAGESQTVMFFGKKLSNADPVQLSYTLNGKTYYLTEWQYVK